MRNQIQKTFSMLTILVTFFSITVWGQKDNFKTNEWLKSWYLLGPLPLIEGTENGKHLEGFENDFLIGSGGEHDPEVFPGKKESVDNATMTWIEYSSSDSIISLDEAISKSSYVAAYAYKEVTPEKAGTYTFALGTNDGGRLWINGVEVWDYPRGRGLAPDDNLIPVYLKEGINKIVLKIEERGNKWEFCARILPFNLDSFTSRSRLFKVVTNPSGETELRFLLSEEIIDNLFDDVKLEIFSEESEEILIWSGEWNKKRIMKLDINEIEYIPYKIKLTADKVNKNQWVHEINFKAGKRIEYILFNNNKTDYRIIVGEDASESEKWAAAELQKFLLEISGAEFPVQSDNSNLGKNEIIIGYNKHSVRVLEKDFKRPELDDESFFYKNSNSNLIILGGSKRGTMYAVFSFLENQFGVRWYSPQVTGIPTRECFKFDYISHFEKPSIQVRNDFYYEAFDPIWAARNKINGAMGYREQHGDIEGYWSVHTFYKFMSPAEFFESHSEYYSLIDGKRIHENAQLCLTNPDVLDIITERLKLIMRENPHNLIYSVSQNDWRNPCACNNCLQIVRETGTESGIMVWFVNQVARRIKEEFPQKYVGTLAYQYTRKPPTNIKPDDNVVIRLCSIECCFAHDFKSCPENQEFLSDLQGWSAISPHLYIWDYVVNFSHYIMPYPNFNVLQSNINTFRENKSIGIMEQAAYQSRGGEFAELRAYVISKLLWDSQCDVDEVINDFMFGYYGRSGQFIRSYFDLLHAQVTPNTHIHLGLKPEDKIFSDEFISSADGIFDDAERVAENDEIKERVEMARLPLMYLKCKRDPLKSKYDGTYERFDKIVEREGITHFAEAGQPQIEVFHTQIKNAK